MLVLSRRVDEVIEIGPDIRIVVVRAHEGIVRLGIDAPREVTIHRKEVADQIRLEQKRAREAAEQS